MDNSRRDDWLIIGALLLLLWMRVSSGLTTGANLVPTSEEGLHVLVLVDIATKDNYPTGQKDMLAGTAFRDWLQEHTDKDGEDYGFRILPIPASPEEADTAFQNSPQVFRDLYDVYTQTEGRTDPWVVASDGRRGINEPLPEDLQSTTAKLETLVP